MALKTHVVRVEYLFRPIALPVQHAIFATLSRTYFSINMEIPAPPPLVWSVMSDVERWPEWTASISRVILLSPGPLQVGNSVRVHQPKLPSAVWRVTELTPGTGFTWISAAPGVRVTARHMVDAMGSGSRVNLSIYYEGSL